MNRKNKIFFVVLTFIVSLMIGYALFSETVTVSGTATATGQFNLTTTCQAGVAREYSDLYGLDIPSELPEGGYEDDYCTASGSQVMFGANLLYPTAQRFFTVRVKNTGSMNAILDPETGLDMEDGQLCADYDDDGSYDDCLEASYNDMKFVLFGDETIMFLDPSNQLADESDFYTDDERIILKPNYSILFLVFANWPEVFSGPDYEGMTFRHSGMSVKFNFVQETIN